MTTNRPPSCTRDYNDYKPLDKRKPRGGYAPGEYLCTCSKCECGFTGDKRAHECADCAYAGSNRPPSCDLPPEFYKPTLKECPVCGAGAELYGYDTIVLCTRQGCKVVGPDNDPHGRKWNSIPRRSEVTELLDKLDFAMLSSDWNRQDELEDLKHCADKLRKEMGE